MIEHALVITVLTHRVGELYMADVHIDEVNTEMLRAMEPPITMAPTRNEAIISVVEWLSEMVPQLAPNREWRLSVPVFSEN